MAQPTFGDNPVIKPTGKPAFGDNPVVAPQAPAGPRAMTIEDVQRGIAEDAAAPSIGEYALDTAGGALAGGANWLTNLILTPVDLSRMAKESEDVIGAHADKSAWYNRPLTELLFSPETNQDIANFRGKVFSGADTVRKSVDEAYQPKYGPGKFAKAAIPWIGPSMFPSKAALLKSGTERAVHMGADLLAQGALPWAAYEGAKRYGGDAAGLLAALLTGVGTSVGRSIKTPEATIARDYRGTGDRTWEQIVGLQDQQLREFGQDITPAEAHAQVTGVSRSAPLHGQQSAEATNVGQEIAAPYLARRGPQVEAALRTHVLDPLAPTPVEPQMIGPDVAEAAGNEIRSVEQQRTAAEQPSYRAADPTPVDRTQMDAFVADLDTEIARYNPDSSIGNVLREFRQRLVNAPATPGTPGTPAQRVPIGPNGARLPPERANEAVRWESTPAVPGTPGTPEQFAYDRLNLDTVKKEFRDATKQGQIGQVSIPSNVKGVIGGYLDRLDNILTEHGAAAPTQGALDYRRGKEIHADVTRNVVAPVTEGPVGELAGAKTTQDVGKILFPAKPKANDVPGMVDAITRLTARTAQMPAAARQAIEQIFSDIGGKTRSGNREWIGADLAKALAGDPARRARTAAVLNAMGAGPVARQLDSLIEGWQAMGKRLGPNSATAQNLQRTAEMSVTPGTEMVSAFGSGKPWSLLTDLFKEAILRSNQRRVAELAFGSARNAQAAAASAYSQVLPEAASRTGVSALYQYLTSGDQQ